MSNDIRTPETGRVAHLSAAEAERSGKRQIQALRLLDKLGSDIFHPAIGAAVDAYLENYTVDWKP
jgi:hypothetical protein